MDCSDFLAKYSEHRDGGLEKSERRRVKDHLDACSSCKKYDDTLRRGIDLLRSLPGIPVPGDFRPRLAHRIYHLADGERLSRSSGGSGASVLTAFAMSVLLLVAAWTPAMLLSRTEEVVLPAIVVSKAPVSVPSLGLSGRLSRAVASPLRPGRTGGLPPAGGSLSPLYEYSPLYQRSRPGSPSEAGFE